MKEQFPESKATYTRLFAVMRLAVIRPLGKPAAAKRKQARKGKAK